MRTHWYMHCPYVHLRAMAGAIHNPDLRAVFAALDEADETDETGGASAPLPLYRFSAPRRLRKVSRQWQKVYDDLAGLPAVYGYRTTPTMIGIVGRVNCGKTHLARDIVRCRSAGTPSIEVLDNYDYQDRIYSRLAERVHTHLQAGRSVVVVLENTEWFHRLWRHAHMWFIFDPIATLSAGSWHNLARVELAPLCCLRLPRWTAVRFTPNAARIWVPDLAVRVPPPE